VRNFLAILSGVLVAGSAVPYVIEIIKGKTKPRIVSWFTWSLLMAIALAASLADHQYPAALLLAFDMIGTLSVVVLGWRHGDRKVERFDIICQAAALLGVALWFVFKSPAIAVLATVAIDFVGSLPTLKHSWQKPYEETALTFLLSAAAGLCTVLIANSQKVTAIAYPLYIFGINVLLSVIIFARHKHAVSGEPVELRKL